MPHRTKNSTNSPQTPTGVGISEAVKDLEKKKENETE